MLLGRWGPQLLAPQSALDPLLFLGNYTVSISGRNSNGLGEQLAHFPPRKNALRLIHNVWALTSVAQLVGALFHKLKGCGFDSWSGNMPVL